MKFKPQYSVAVFAMVAAVCVQPPRAHAEMITAQQVATKTQPETDRAKIEAFLVRADVKQKLQAFGVSGLFATARVGALNDQEAHLLAQKIETLPAGGNLSNSDLIVILLIAILVALAL